LWEKISAISLISFVFDSKTNKSSRSPCKMSKVFIFELDKPVAESVGALLSKTIVGSKKSEEEDQTESNETSADAEAIKKTSTNYQIYGTANPVNKFPSIKTYSLPSWVSGTV
jgi:hypothetical protein